MSRVRYFWDRAARNGRGDWVVAPPRRGRLGVMVISDALDGVMNPVDGRRYDSKRAYARAVRAAGCEIAGTDASLQGPRERTSVGGIGGDVRRAIEELGG